MAECETVILTPTPPKEYVLTMNEYEARLVMMLAGNVIDEPNNSRKPSNIRQKAGEIYDALSAELGGYEAQAKYGFTPGDVIPQRIKIAEDVLPK